MRCWWRTEDHSMVERWKEIEWSQSTLVVYMWGWDYQLIISCVALVALMFSIFFFLSSGSNKHRVKDQGCPLHRWVGEVPCFPAEWSSAVFADATTGLQSPPYWNGLQPIGDVWTISVQVSLKVDTHALSFSLVDRSGSTCFTLTSDDLLQDRALTSLCIYLCTFIFKTSSHCDIYMVSIYILCDLF